MSAAVSLVEMLVPAEAKSMNPSDELKCLSPELIMHVTVSRVEILVSVR